MASAVAVVAAAVVEVAVPGSAIVRRPVRTWIQVAAALVVSMAFPLPAKGSETDEFPVYNGEQFQALYDYAVANTLPNLDPPNGRYAITGDVDLDERIWDLAFERGYVLRPSASGDLARIGGVPMQPQAAAAWEALRSDARAAGLGFVVSSAYRSPASQRTQFLSKLQGTSDSAIDATLTWYSVPGTSKHHAGYALDFRYADGSFGEFRSTPDYVWLQSDNFAIPKSHGLIPSYPDDVADQGPNPEPWEFVWVGQDLIRCGVPQQLGVVGSGPAGAILRDIESCPGGTDGIELPGWMS